MPLTRLTQLWAKIEANYGVDPTLEETDAVLVSNLQVTPDRPVISRPMDGNSTSRQRAGVLGRGTCKVSFDLELRGNSAALSASVEPIYGRFLRSCRMRGMWDATGGAEKWSYVPALAGAEGQSVCLEYYTSNLMRQILGCRGTFKLKCAPGDVAMYSFEFTGLYADIAEVTQQTGDYSSDVAPPICGGGSFQPYSENPAVDVEGHVLSLEIDQRNILSARGSSSVAAASSRAGVSRIRGVGYGSPDDPGMAGVVVVEQKSTGQDDWWARWQSRTLSGSCSYAIGTAAGNRHLIYMSRLEIVGLQDGDDDGVGIHTCDVRLMSSDDDVDNELAIICHKNA